MVQKMNSERKHYLAPWTSDAKKPADTDYQWLAAGIMTMGNDSEDKTEDYNDYTGINTTDVTGVQTKWTPEGLLDLEDPAQKIVADRRYEIGDGRKVWHKWVETDGNTYSGIARLLEIKIGGGDSNTKESISFTIQHDRKPEKATKE